jgi:excisionase family DNA binding protein
MPRSPGHHSDVNSSPGKETMTKRERKLLRVGAAAQKVGLHPITLRRWMKAGRIQAVPIGREVRVPRGSDRAVGGQTRRATPGPLWQGERTRAKWERSPFPMMIGSPASARNICRPCLPVVT